MAVNKVEFTLEVKDEASSKVKKASEEILKQNQRTERETQKNQQDTSRRLTQEQRERQRMLSQTQRLGIRSEQTIQREINKTENAYKRLAQSGKASANDLARAQTAAKSRIAELNAELGKTSTLQKGMNFGRNALSLGAGVTAGGYYLKNKMNPHVDYDTRLAYIANTAYSDRKDVAGRQAGMAELDAMIKGAVNKYGGTRESAADTLNNLISSDAFNDSEIKSLFPMIQKYSTASGAAPEELGNIVLRAKQTMGIKPEDMSLLLDKAIRAGDLGGFELTDMARWLPQQFSAAKSAGLSGFAGVDKVLSMNQAAMITAGSTDEAGNNLVNLLTKISSRDLAKSAEKNMTINGKSINLASELAKGREKGDDSLTTFVSIMDRFVSANPEIQKVREKALNSKNSEERSQALSDMTNLLEGSQIGKIVADRQALMGLSAIMGNRKYMEDIQSGLSTAQGAGQTSFDLIQSTTGYKWQDLSNKKIFAEQDALKGTIETSGDLAKALSEYAEQYPGLTKSIVRATTALGTFAVVAGGASLSGLFMGGKGGLLGGLLSKMGGSTVGRVGTTIVKGAGGMIAREAGLLTTSFKMLNGATQGAIGKLGMLAAAGYAGYEVGTKIHDKIDSSEDGRVFLDSLGERLTGLMAFFGSKEAQMAQENNAVGKGLIQNDITDYSQIWKSRAESEQANKQFATAATEFTTSVANQKQAADKNMEAANALMKATSTPIPISITVNPGSGMFNVIAEKASKDNLRN